MSLRMVACRVLLLVSVLAECAAAERLQLDATSTSFFDDFVIVFDDNGDGLLQHGEILYFSGVNGTLDPPPPPPFVTDLVYDGVAYVPAIPGISTASGTLNPDIPCERCWELTPGNNGDVSDGWFDTRWTYVIAPSVDPFVQTAPCVDDPAVKCATGVGSFSVMGDSYDVEFVPESFNTTFADVDPLFIPEPGQSTNDSGLGEAMNAVSEALTAVDSLFGVVGKGTERSVFRSPACDAGALACVVHSFCAPRDVNGCGVWAPRFSVVTPKDDVLNGPEIYGPYARFSLATPPPEPEFVTWHATGVLTTVETDGGFITEYPTAAVGSPFTLEILFDAASPPSEEQPGDTGTRFRYLDGPFEARLTINGIEAERATAGFNSIDIWDDFSFLGSGDPPADGFNWIWGVESAEPGGFAQLALILRGPERLDLYSGPGLPREPSPLFAELSTQVVQFTDQADLIVGLVDSVIVAPEPEVLSCDEPVQLAHIMENLAVGFTTDPADLQPDIVRASRAEPVRGFVHPENGDVGSVHCDTDHILHYVYFGAGGDTAEERIQEVANFRDRFAPIDLFIDGQPIDAPDVLETEPQDGFSPLSGNPMGFIFVGWISEPRTLPAGMHESRIDLIFDAGPLPFEFVSNFEVISVDTDGDGIADDIDGTFNGVFDDQSGVFSNDFTDQHLGGTTRGTVILRGTDAISVTDDAADGVMLGASGPGLSLVQMCGPSNIDIFNVLLTDGDQVAVTCGSLMAEVLNGPVEIEVGINVTITIPAGASALMEQMPGGLLSITNLGGPEITVEDDNGSTPVGPGDPPLVTPVDDGSAPAPENLIARAKPGIVSLRWSAVDGADRYDVYRSAVSGGPYELIGSTSNTAFADRDVATGDTWYHVVRSIVGPNSSPDSAEVEVSVSARRRR